MKLDLQQKRTMVNVLSLLVLLPLASPTAGVVVGGDIDKGLAQDILHNQKFDTAYLLRHAIKVDKNNLRGRLLDEAGNEGEGGEQQGEQNANNNNEDNQVGDDGDNNEKDEDEKDEEDDPDDENEQQDNEQENEQDNEGNDNKEDENAQEGENDDIEENGEEGEDEEDENVEENEAEEEEVDEEEQDINEDEDERPQVNFLKCAAFTIEPNIVDIDAMIENGEVDEDEAAQIENSHITTQMTSNLNTQDSVIFFTYGNVENDAYGDIYMIDINDWITASYGNDQICNAVDQDDVDTVFSQIPSYSSVQKYSSHAWYAGFNCKSDGTGVKPQLFLDETCNTFSPTVNKYYPFKSAFKSQENSNQVPSDETTYMIESIDNAFQNTQYCDESDFCNDVFENSINVATCEGEKRNRNLESYQIEYDGVSSIEDACPSIQSALNMNGYYENSSYELEQLVLMWSNTMDGAQEADRHDWSYYLWLYIGGLLAVGSILTCLIRRKKRRVRRKTYSKNSFASDESTIETKREPLVDKSALPRSESDIVEDLSAIECQVTEKKRGRKSRKRSKSQTRKSSKSRSRSRRRFRDLLPLKSSGSQSSL